MRMRHLLLSMVVIGFALSITNSSACVIGYKSQSCGGVGFSCSIQINVPVDAWEKGGAPVMQPVGCCGGFAATMVDIDWDCNVAMLHDPKSPEQPVEPSLSAELYAPDCDGWLRPFRYLSKRSVKPV